MPPVATRIRSLADVLVGQPANQSDGLPFDALAGFDAVTQFSHNLLNRQVVRSLVQHSLASLSAYATWDSVSVPASLLAAIPPRLRIQLTAREARLEVRLAEPYLSALHWPVDIGPPQPETTSGRAIPQRRTADVSWRIEINLLTRRLVAGFDQASQSQSGGSLRFSASGSPRSGGVLGEQPEIALLTASSSMDDGSWDRLTLVSGRAVTRATAKVVIQPSLWRFGVELDFSATDVLTTGEEQALTEFLATNAGQNLLTQALVLLKSGAGVRLTPEVAPAGPLSASTLQSMNLPAISVHDVLLIGDRGQFILSLCVELDGASGGVLRFVQPFVGRDDFGYAVSAKLLGPAYKACWSVAANGMSFVGETSVELPVDNDPNNTLPGRAQLMISFSNVLDEVAITTVADGNGDAVRLLSKQRIQLLNLWDNQGHRITDLGELANPQDEILLLPINLFEQAGATPEELHPNFRDFLIKLIAILVLPLSEPFSIRVGSVSGFCSNPLQTMLVRWAHKTLVDDVRPPVPETSAVQT
jgi:hypothetical protein